MEPRVTLAPLVGEWTMEATFPGAPPTDPAGRTVFECMSDERFLIQRWQVPHPAAPDGIAIIGFDEQRDTYLQHYFDSRGVARVYEMRLQERVWTLSRTAADFAPLDFSQRFTGTFSDDGATITGAWESAHDGANWEHDFGLTYRRSGG
jgi:hypothetical protein